MEPALEIETRRVLGLGTGAAVTFETIVEGGSARSFHRASDGNGRSCVVMTYGSDKEENLYYVEIAEFLRSLGLNIPRVIAHQEGSHVAWMEDLGPVDLYSLRAADWVRRKPAYLKTLEQVHRLHQRGLKALGAARRPVRLMAGFDASLYGWERGYFLEQFVRSACGLELSAVDASALESELAALAEELLAQPAVLVHRDFQSKNVMLRGGEAYLIDFQGLRRGVASYDLGSLLFDPYVPFTPGEREELLHSYHSLGSDLSWPELQQAVARGAVQRLMQALGAYGFLGLKQGKRDFLRYIAPGLANLERAMAEVGEMPRLEALLSRVHRVLLKID